MTYSVVPALRASPSWLPSGSRGCFTRVRPAGAPATEKTGATCGMAMTEKQGGSDVRATRPRAPSAATGGGYLLTGHKWFCSAPMCDAFLVLAQAPGGLSCFLVPRWLPDGTRNRDPHPAAQGQARQPVQRVERDRARRRVGAPGRRRGPRRPHDHRDGQPHAARLRDRRRPRACARPSRRRSTTPRTAHAFGKPLVDQPLMAQRARRPRPRVRGRHGHRAAARRRRTTGRRGRRARAAVQRLATAVVKYWVCKRAAAHAAEAMECLGGNGYVEESGMPAPVPREPAQRHLGGIGQRHLPRRAARHRARARVARGVPRRGRPRRRRRPPSRRGGRDARSGARRPRRHRGAGPAGRRAMALLLQASLLVRHSPAAVADAFCASRLAGDSGRAFGTLPLGADSRAIVARARPLVA